jgi:hypothetical protein
MPNEKAVNHHSGHISTFDILTELIWRRQPCRRHLRHLATTFSASKMKVAKSTSLSDLDPAFRRCCGCFRFRWESPDAYHFAANAPGAGPLVNPWAITRAPSHFGRFSNMLLIENVEDGKINAFNPETGAFLGPLTDSNNNVIVIPGLWDLSFGDGRNNGRANQLFFDAGPNAHDPAGNRLFGVILATGTQGNAD